MNRTEKWQSTVQYFDEEGTEIKIKTNTQLKTFKKLKILKYADYENKRMVYTYILKSNGTTQLELF